MQGTFLKVWAQNKAQYTPFSCHPQLRQLRNSSPKQVKSSHQCSIQLVSLDQPRLTKSQLSFLTENMRIVDTRRWHHGDRVLGSTHGAQWSAGNASFHCKPSEVWRGTSKWVVCCAWNFMKLCWRPAGCSQRGCHFYKSLHSQYNSFQHSLKPPQLHWIYSCRCFW